MMKQLGPGPLQFACSCLMMLTLGCVVPVLASMERPDAASESQTGAAPAFRTHCIQSGDTLLRIASSYRAETGHFALSDMLGTILAANEMTTESLLFPGRFLLIPICPPTKCPVVPEPSIAGADLRGIYLPGVACGFVTLFDRVDRFIAAGGNGVVFDAKGVADGVFYRSHQPLADCERRGRGVVITSLAELLERLQERRLYVVARIACFLDNDLGRRRPDLALTDSSGAVWTERDQVWLDPANAEVRAYLLGVAVELARAGVHEIQFDYVRYPTNGWATVSGTDIATTAKKHRRVITSFLREARESLAPHSVLISADLFGIMAYARPVDLAATGQDIAEIAEHVDFICPMVYPSHYDPGFMGFEQPADEPAAVVAEACRRFTRLAAGKARIRPWLQAFAWRTSQYDAAYVSAQIEGGEAGGSDGYCLWNAACRYSIALTALQPPAVTVTVADPSSAQPGPWPFAAGLVSPFSAVPAP
ncbi:MAG: putative glycoside hydrolase [bacterium]